MVARPGERGPATAVDDGWMPSVSVSFRRMLESCGSSGARARVEEKIAESTVVFL
jgi:hypothetical protein